MRCPPAPQSLSPLPRSQRDSIQEVKYFKRITNPCHCTNDKVFIGNKRHSKATAFIFQADPMAMHYYDDVIPVLDLIPLSTGPHCGCRSIGTGFALLYELQHDHFLTWTAPQTSRRRAWVLPRTQASAA